ncbi:membrane-bound transcription factor site-2 protease isoform X1 [Takifugu flavidus]|uniref:membrane-bound transcription factor site-2 protease isoform X1 n=1 Tax=Takifugu flavidus TaxID=433684 RepID=UPI002544BB7C|nr:membrane-bound transcription factor site-2 protease isoform X1 [Takifugu flavidus]
MIPVPLLVCVMAAWCAVYLADTLLRSSPTYRFSYESWLASRGLMLSPFHVRWQTTMFNRLFAYCARINPRALYLWFNGGLVFGIVAMLGSVVLLIQTLQQTLAQMTTNNPRMGAQQALQVVVPGVNIPTSQLAYFFIALLLSGVIHELGHAVAALREQVRVNGFGMFVFVVYPGAFVDLFTTHLNLISPTQQLRIFCAGVWHNFVLCVAALAFLFLLPLFLFPVYSTGSGALVTEIVQGSPADGPRGLSVGDIVTGLEDCPVRGVEDWSSCLFHLSHTPQTGYCVPVASLQPSWAHGRAFKRLDGTMDCCSNNSLTDLCFSYIKPQSRNDREREHSGETRPELNENLSLLLPAPPQYACMPVRKMVTGTRACRTDSDCTVHSSAASVCVTPSLENQTRFIRVTHPPNTHMLFVGYPPHLQYAVSLTNFVPRFGFLHLDLPIFLETFFKYVVSLSGALAVVNSVPCFALDGQWMLNALLEATLAHVVTDRQKRELVGFFLLLGGSALLAANVALGLWMVTAR